MIEFDYSLDYKNVLFKPNDKRYRIGRKFLEMGFTRARRYANHKSGKKYDKNGKVRPQEKDWATSDKAKSAKIFKQGRDRVTTDPKYILMRKQWREGEKWVNI